MVEEWEWGVSYTYDNGLTEAFDHVIVCETEALAWKNVEWVSEQPNVKDVRAVRRPIGDWEDA